MIRIFFAPALAELNVQNAWFQQDGATAHTSRALLQVLKEMVPVLLISLRGDVPWRVRSPDLTPCNFFLWGYLKAEVYKHRSRTLRQLKDAIPVEIRRISQEMFVRVMQNYRNRLRQYCDNTEFDQYSF